MSLPFERSETVPLRLLRDSDTRNPFLEYREKRRSKRLLSTGLSIASLFVVGVVISHKSQRVVLMRENSKDDEWSRFKERYGKRYDADEEMQRQRAFQERLERLKELNRLNGEEVFGVTEHADRLVPKQFARGRRPRDQERDSRRQRLGLRDLENIVETRRRDAVDWRKEGGVITPVKNQGQCGQCWAVSAASQVESALALAGAPSTELSFQQITSCAVSDDCCDGCGGGDPTAAYEYLLGQHRNLSPEALWPSTEPLTPEEGECNGVDCTSPCLGAETVNPLDYDYLGPYATVTGYSFVVPECTEGSCPNQNVSLLTDRLLESPISVCVNAEHWDDYVGGVLSAAACGGSSADDIDHCVQLVGYNRTANYFLLRNQWSAAWGEDGYIRLQLDANSCGIANEATIVHVDGQWSDPLTFEAQPPAGDSSSIEEEASSTLLPPPP